MLYLYLFLTAAIVPALCVTGVLYIRVIRPMQARLRVATAGLQELNTQVAEERYVRADLVKWIEIECFSNRTIEKALKQRIDERLEVLRFLRNERQQYRK